MATTAPSRPRAAELHIHDDHSHKETASGTATSALGVLPLNSIHNLKTRSSIESLACRLDNFHIYSSDKENKSRPTLGSVSRVESAAPSGKDVTCVKSHEDSGVDENNPLAIASLRLPSTKEQLSKHQEGQFEWLLSIPVKRAAKGRRPRGEYHGDAELHRGEKTLYFGCNLVRRRTQSGGTLEKGKSTDVYTLLATRIKGEEEFAMAIDAEIAKLQSSAADRLCLSDAPTAEHYQGSGMPKSPGLVLDVKEVAGESDGDSSRPSSRIEDSVETLAKLEEEIEALTQIAQLERVLSPNAATRNTNASSAKPTPIKGATSGRGGATPIRGMAVERASSVRRPTSTGEDEKTTSRSATPSAPSARKVPRPTSLLPPKPPAKSSKAPTVSTFELPGEAVARRLKEQREQRRSQQVSSEQAAALAAAYSPSKPHFKSSKPPTRPTFELPGEAISRKKREEREAKLRAQEEEERKRREFKARPIRASLVPNTVPRETRTSLVRQKSRATEGSSDSATTTITPVSSKRHSLAAASATPTATTSATFPSRGRNADPAIPSTTTTNSSRAHSTTPSQASIHSRSSKQTGGADEAGSAPQKPLRGKEVYARDNSVRDERERERRERENAARVAREKAAERSREMSRLWAEKQRLKRELEMRKE
ncbi:hypothetical protein N658DRAFT_515944 [Parathielavia hyrcaniae]|uniref:Uncharacterized protein n=1 Tax=Parathielavia hyrcaniae TaxID=113614 RepID=A0AAN6Q601_9PEZI|nr:hypothetical protein N658DRAFT_515944 [Parathielavia hyrcaniae]